MTAATPSARAVLIDCDPGTDDAVALLFALASPELDVRLITTVGGNVGLTHTLRNARAIVGLTGRDISVVGGAARSLLAPFVAEERVHGANGIGGVILPDGPAASPGLAADTIRDALRSAGPAGMTLVGIGPATNLALALATEPSLAAHVAEIVLMTGALAEGNITPSAEFNAWNDPEALAIVLAAGRPTTLATLELTSQALCTPERLRALAGPGGGACLRAVHDILSTVPMSQRLGGTGVPQHDLCAIAWLAAPGLFTGRAAHAYVDLRSGPTRGRTIIDRWNRAGRAPNVRLLETVDAPGLFELLRVRLASMP